MTPPDAASTISDDVDAGPGEATPIAPLAPPDQSILDAHPTPPAVTTTIESVIEGHDAELLWEAYRLNFSPLEELAILQHLYEREEVLAELANPRITKLVGWEGDTPVGLAMLTNHLESVPQISPRYLRAKYPDHAAADRIYFGILVAVSPEHRGMTLFNRLYMEMWNIPAREGGVLVFDICEFNRMAFDTDSLVQRIGSNFPSATVETIDRQTWYAAELPHPLPGT
ncbi:hypothetical protein [Ilumatobacter coccineus]|uniref:N-acetyltransferase domain-containing protein n=1 Tax=Ilumatobacter coccineus (strain NBRC 103263 / KCTC 29153 / YM16-304) TaxID=1313172 RepID=A0A6C7EBS7_ILUCY|nr:hypothetical protein [Ilumatobacter coccineus]BAN02098.1 hypothetical protein YM304_17840 [Ilumatobacter coccineus YM16-304]